MSKTARVELITDGDVIRAVQDQIVPGNLRGERVVIQHCVNQRELNVGVDARQRSPGGFHFRLAHRRVAVQRLALQVGHRHGIEIQQRHASCARRGKVLRGGAAQPAQPDDQHAGRLERFLTFEIKPAQHNLAVVAHHLLIAQLHRHVSLRTGG